MKERAKQKKQFTIGTIGAINVKLSREKKKKKN